MALTGLSGKVAVVTGGAGGIGRAVGRRLGEEGSRVVVVDLDESAAQEAADALDGVEAIGLGADVATEEGTDAYVAAAVQRFGRIDLFHNNAGTEGRAAPLVDSEPADFDRLMAVNLRGVYLGLRAVLRQMRAQGGGGSIVNSSSLAGLRGFPGLGPYVASKHAVLGLTRTAAVENATSGVRVNAICPGPIGTRMMDSIESMTGPDDPARVRGRFERASPMRRYGTPDEVAALVAWLFSDESSYVNGAVHSIDGGTVAT